MRRRCLVIGVSAVAVLAAGGALLAGDEGIVTLYRTWRQMGKLNDSLETSQRMIDSLENEIERLTGDTTYMEQIAREKFGMVRKNEKMYKFVEEK